MGKDKTMITQLKRSDKTRGIFDLVVNGIGLSIHGESRWTRQKHGKLTFMEVEI